MNSNFMFNQPVVGLPDGVALLSTDAAKEAIDKGEFGLLVDVRSEEEWNNGRLPGAVHAPIKDVSQLSKLEPHKEEKILLYCRTQRRSSMIARLLHEKGYRGLNVMNGGFTGWDQKGYPKV